MIDVSGSIVGGKPEEVKKAAMHFISLLKEDDEVGVIAFSDTSTVVCSLTSDKQKVKNEISSLNVSGSTNIWDSVDEALEMLRREGGSKAVILLTDGGRNVFTFKTREGVARKAVKLGVPMYTIGLGGDADVNELEALASETGGKFYFAPTPEDLKNIYGEIAKEMARVRGYLVTYKSPKQAYILLSFLNKARKVKVVVKLPGGGSYEYIHIYRP